MTNCFHLVIDGDEVFLLYLVVNDGA